MNIKIAVGAAFILGFAAAFFPGFAVIPWLRRLKFGQTILDLGPSWHKKKQGTPTMGGLLIIGGFVLSVAAVLATRYLTGGDILFGEDEKKSVMYAKLLAGLLMALCMAMVGFMDDYIKVVKKRNLGLTERQKTCLQLIIAAVYLVTLYKNGVNYMFVPYYGYWANTFVFFALGIIAIYCTVNAVNFTDGVDSLCSSVTLCVSVAFCVAALLQKAMGLGVAASALAGALGGFLCWNKNPAKVMMGDTGSLFLGGLVCAFAYTLDAPWLIICFGIVYVLEFASDILQIFWSWTHHGARLFRMAPLHHHYEKGGWSENRISLVFSLISILGGAAGIALMIFGKPV